MDKNIKKIPKVFVASLVFFFVLLSVAYACHGGSIFFIPSGSLETVSMFDDSSETLLVTLSEKTISVTAPIRSYNSTYDNYTLVTSPCEFFEEYKGTFIDTVQVSNAVYSFEAINGSRLDQNGNGKIDVYNASLPDELDSYNNFLVVPVYDITNVTDQTLYLRDAIIYALNEPYTCVLCDAAPPPILGGPTGKIVIIDPMTVFGILIITAMLISLSYYYIVKRMPKK